MSFPILERSLVLDTPYYVLEKQLVALPNGEKVDWYIKRHRDVVIVIPINKDGKFLLQKSYKHGMDLEVIEFCTGLIEKNETPQAAAQRELLEETGLVPDALHKIGSALAAPTSTDIVYHIFLAQNCCATQKQNLEITEKIAPFWLNDEKTIDLFFQKNAPNITGATLTAWAWYKINKTILDT